MPLFVTQFLGAFNDNFLKNALIVMFTYKLFATDSSNTLEMLVNVASALFIMPYFIFSSLAGQLADKFDRARCMRWVKALEIVIMAFTFWAFVRHSVYGLLGLLFLMGAQSTFFSPAKFSLLPQLLKEDELLAGNAFLSAGSYLAILLGTVTGGLLIIANNGEMWSGVLGIFLAIWGFVASMTIPPAPAPEPQMKINWNFIRESYRIWLIVRRQKLVKRTIIAVSVFWMVGVLYLSQLGLYVKNILHCDNQVLTFYVALFSIGIGIGSFLCNHLQRERIKMRFVVIGVLLMSCFTLLLAYWSMNPILPVEGQAFYSLKEAARLPIFYQVSFSLLIIAVGGGMYSVPLTAYMQQKGRPQTMARIIAMNNILNAIAMTGGSVVAMALLYLGASLGQLFIFIALVELLAAWYVISWRRVYWQQITKKKSS